MGDLLRTGAAWLEAQRKAHLATDVVYTQGETSVTVAATLGRTECEVTDDAGVTVKATVMDFLVTDADLGLTPEPGDTITANGRTFEVIRVNGTCWTWSDAFQITRRIHTQDVGAVS